MTLQVFVSNYCDITVLIAVVIHKQFLHKANDTMFLQHKTIVCASMWVLPEAIDILLPRLIEVR